VGLLEGLLERKRDFLSILLRFIDMPDKDEAARFGGLLYSDGFNSEKRARLTDAAASLPRTANPTKYAVKAFITASLKSGCCWPQAVIAEEREGYFTNQLIEALDDDPAAGVIISILNQIKARNYKSGAIYAASEIGRKIQWFADILAVKIDCFVDSDKRLRGSMIGTLPVISLNEVSEEIDYYIIASIAYAEQIGAMLRARYADNIKKPELFFLDT
jgi:hypothetical protein